MNALRCAALLMMLASCAPTLAQPDGVDEKPVSVEANAKSLDGVLADIAKQVGLGIIHKGSEGPKITLSLTEIPFAGCMHNLADFFSLVIRWEGEVLVVQSVQEAIEEAGRQLEQGRVAATVILSALAEERRPMYGSKELREELSQALGTLLRARAQSVLSGGTMAPDVAWALVQLAGKDAETRATLAVVAVRGLIRQGPVQEALSLWETSLKGQDGPHVAAAEAELFMALHYLGAPQAADFWAETFDASQAATLLQEVWRQKAYGAGLHLARLNLKYAMAAGRVEDAQAVQTAVAACLNSQRVVQVTCAVDREATTDTYCEAKIRHRIAHCSEVYERTFGIKFAIGEFILWDPPSDNDFDKQYAALKTALGERRPELTIGFILEVIGMHPNDFDPGHAHLWTGYGCPHMGAYLLTRDFSFEHVTETEENEWVFSSGAVSETLVHEMGHMFGALHVDDKGSVMRPVSDRRHTCEFDEVNTRIIARHKWQDMSLGGASLDEPELLGLIEDYREIAKLCSQPNGANEEEARVHLALARLYLRRLDPARARAQLEQVIAIGAPEDIVAEARKMLGVG